MKILFVTRKYPPITGGMERYSKELYEALSKIEDVELLANRRGNRYLFSFLAAAAFKLMRDGYRYDAIHFGDGLLASLIPVARSFSKSRITITAHGLDVTYGNPIYRRIVLPLIAKADGIVAISGNTKRLCLERGLPERKIQVIPNGVDLDPLGRAAPRRPERLPAGFETGPMLITLGRLVRRKGHEWFVREVMPRLAGSFTYVVAGDGPERGAVERAAAEAGVGDRVVLLGSVSEAEKEWLLRSGRLFVMPNVPVAGDVEGFGLVLTEAASRGLYAVAADIDGIPDAVIPGRTGTLTPPLDAGAFADAVLAATPDRGVVEAAARSFGWDLVASRYAAFMSRLPGHDSDS